MRQIELLRRPGSADKSDSASIDLTWAVTGATWLVVALLVSGVAGDPDFWGHLRFGLDILAQRQLTAVDPYSFTQDVPWVNHEWLSELLMAAAFQTAGFVGNAAPQAWRRLQRIRVPVASVEAGASAHDLCRHGHRGFRGRTRHSDDAASNMDPALPIDSGEPAATVAQR